MATQICFLFSPRKLGKMNPFSRNIFPDGLVQPPTSQLERDFIKSQFVNISIHQPNIEWEPFGSFLIHQLFLFGSFEVGLLIPTTRADGQRWGVVSYQTCDGGEFVRAMEYHLRVAQQWLVKKRNGTAYYFIKIGIILDRFR